MKFLLELRRRNPVLFWYGILNFIAAIICLGLWMTTGTLVTGINAFIKPLKFYVSIGIFVWTAGWLFYYLEMPKKLLAFNIMTVIIFTFESFVITWQAVNGRISHFNITTPLYAILFSLMGVAILILTLWTGYIGYLFFKKKDWKIPMPYVWGIRLGILFFVVFALEGGIMAAAMKHTVGETDGGSGFPLVNWSRRNGDLRVAHFFGMHTLQLFPLCGYYFAKTNRDIFIFVTLYILFVLFILIRALSGLPFV